MEYAPKKPQIWILALLVSFANLLGVFYVTALPNLTEYFQVTKAQAQQTITFYLIGCIAALLIYPNLAKSIGRKPSIYIGHSLAIVGSLFCLIALKMDSFSFLLFARWLTASGAGCGAILTSTMVADSFSFAESKKVFSYLTGAFIVLPAIGITLGGAITEWMGWQVCFYFMLFYSVLIFGLCFLLPETAQEKDLKHLRVLNVVKAYLRQCTNVHTLLHSLIIACASVILYVFSSEAPFIAKNTMGISPNDFGLYNLIPNAGFLLGGVVFALLSHRLSTRKWSLLLSCGFFLFSFYMWTLFRKGFINLETLFGLPFCIFFVSAIIVPHSQASALAQSADKPHASAFIYIVQYAWIILSISALRFFPPQNPAILPMIYSISGLLMVILWWMMRYVKHPAGKS